MNREAHPPRTYVFGAGGFLGRRFLGAYRQADPAAAGADLRADPASGIECFDLEAPKVGPLRLKERGFRDALIVAAVSKIGACERDPVRARRINVDGTLSLIRQLVEQGIRPLFASSDYVFDGRKGGYTEEDALNPGTEYGRHKAEVERRIASLTGGRHLVVRLAKVFSLDFGDGTLLDEMAGILRAGGVVSAACDQVFCPILADDLLRIVMRLQVMGTTGLVNVGSPIPRSRYDMAVDVAQALGLPASRVRRVSIDEVCPEPPRPHNTSLDISKLRGLLSPRFKPWATCVARVAANWKERA